MKLFISVLLPVVVLLLVGALIGPNFVDWNKYKSQGQEQVKKHTGYDLVMDGDVRVSVFPSPHLIVRDARLKAPVKSRVDDLLTIKSLEVYVSLIPLLQGKVEVSAVNLVEPQIALEVSADGTPNWLTSEVRALQNKGGSDDQSSVQSPDVSAGVKISFDQVRVKDARFQYYDAKSKALQVLEDIDLDLSAESLQGPFSLDGDFALNGMDVVFQASVKELDVEGKTLPLKLDAVVDKTMKLKFGGVVDYGDHMGAQGESEFSLSGLRRLAGNSDLPDSLSMKGFVTAGPKKISYKSLDLKIGDNALKGSLSVALSPLLVVADLKAVSGLNLQPLLPVFDNFALKLNAAMAGKNFEFKNTRLDLDGQSVLLNGSYAPASSAKSRAKASVGVVAGALNLDKILSKIPRKSADKPDVEGGASLGAPEVKAMAKSFSLPLDLSVKADVQSLTYDGQLMRGVKVRGAVAGNSLQVQDLSIEKFVGSAISLNGEVKNLSALSGISANLALKSADVRKLAKFAGVDTASFPAGLKAVNLKSFVQGDLDNLNFTTNISAMGGAVIAKGKAEHVLKDPAFSGLVLQVQHPNVSKAIQGFAGGKGYPTLAKPLDFYAKIETEGKLYRLNNMSVDLAGTPVKGALAIDLGGKKPKISGDLNMGDFSMVSAAGKAAQVRAASGHSAVVKSRTEKDRWSSDLIDTGFLHVVDLDLALAAKSLRVDNWALSKPSLKIILKDGALNIQNLNAALYGGTMNIDALLKAENKKNAPLSVSAKVKLRDVAIEKLTTSLAAGSKLVKGTGRISLDTEIKTLGSSQRSMVNVLSGNGQVSGRDIVLDGFDLTRFVRAMDVNAKPGDSLLGLWKGSTKGGSTAFDTLEGAFTISKGIVDITAMDMDGKMAFLGTTGTVNLPKWWIKTDHTITLRDNEEVPPFEMSFDGSLDNPKQTFAEGPLNDYLGKKISRKLEKVLSDKLGKKLGNSDALGGVISDAVGGDLGGALGGFLGGLQQEKTQQPQQQSPAPVPANDNQPVPQSQEIKPEEAIEGLLKGLFSQ